MKNLSAVEEVDCNCPEEQCDFVIYIIIKHKEEFKMNNDNKYSSHNH